MQSSRERNFAAYRGPTEPSPPHYGSVPRGHVSSPFATHAHARLEPRILSRQPEREVALNRRGGGLRRFEPHSRRPRTTQIQVSFRSRSGSRGWFGTALRAHGSALTDPLHHVPACPDWKQLWKQCLRLPSFVWSRPGPLFEVRHTGVRSSTSSVSPRPKLSPPPSGA
jgi:hypothetical protein